MRSFRSRTRMFTSAGPPEWTAIAIVYELSPSGSAESIRRSALVASDWLPAVGVRLQMRSDALPGERFLYESRNDVHVSMENFLPADAPTVPTDVVSVWR